MSRVGGGGGGWGLEVYVFVMEKSALGEGGAPLRRRSVKLNAVNAD